MLTGLFAGLVFLIIYINVFGKNIKNSVQEKKTVSPVIPTFITRPNEFISPTFPVKLSDMKIIISGIPLNNFYKKNKQILPSGEVLIENTQDYHFVYFPKNYEFLISIQNKPFEEVRYKAENKFLEEIGIDRKAVCSLNVSVTTPNSINPEFAGKIYPLSFCGKGL